VSADAIAAVSAAFDAAGHGDPDALPPLCAESVIWRGSPSWGAAYCSNRRDLGPYLARVRRVIGVERFEASELACSLAADQVVLRLRWFFPDHEDDSYQHVTLRQGRVVLIQDYLDRAEALAALGAEPGESVSVPTA